ncbi:MAG: serine hydrolase [Flavobacteriaceae bacterium]
MKKTLPLIALLVISLWGILYISDYNYLLTAISKIYLKGHTTAFLSDYQYFDNTLLPPSQKPQPWPIHKKYNSTQLPNEIEQKNAAWGTVAFLIIKNDSLYFEKYYDGYGVDSKSNSFSMSKSYIAAMLGKAIDEGYVKSIDQPVIDFIPELKGDYASQVTVGDLASMASGQRWDEAYYSPTSVTTAAYFVEDLGQLILDQPIEEQPGISFKYKSGTTQLLAMVIARATGKTLTEYLYESLWNPIGSEHESSWQVDSKENGLEKAYCCIASNARDFARLGKLYKDFGKWNGERVLDSTFIAHSLKARFEKSPQYGYSWWLKQFKGYNTFMMRGHLGQYVIVFPEENMILIRLGHSKGPDSTNDDPFTPDIYAYMEAALELNTHASEP